MRQSNYRRLGPACSDDYLSYKPTIRRWRYDSFAAIVNRSLGRFSPHSCDRLADAFRPRSGPDPSDSGDARRPYRSRSTQSLLSPVLVVYGHFLRCSTRSICAFCGVKHPALVHLWSLSIVSKPFAVVSKGLSVTPKGFAVVPKALSGTAKGLEMVSKAAQSASKAKYKYLKIKYLWPDRRQDRVEWEVHSPTITARREGFSTLVAVEQSKQ